MYVEENNRYIGWNAYTSMSVRVCVIVFTANNIKIPAQSCQVKAILRRKSVRSEYPIWTDSQKASKQQQQQQQE